VNFVCRNCEKDLLYFTCTEILYRLSYNCFVYNSCISSNTNEKGEMDMVQSIQTGSNAIYNLSQSFLGTGKVSTSETQKSSEASKNNEDETITTSSQGDTVTISTAGAQQAAKIFSGQSANRPSVDGLSEDTYTDSTAELISSAAADAGITEYTAVKNQNSADAAAISSESSSDSSSTDSNLSEYTLSELKEMLENGDITQAEYNAEVQSRQQSSTTSDSEDSDEQSNKTQA
jgi:hypothetical protein